MLTENLTAQRIFDYVALQMALQGGPSREGMYCMYRDPNGRKCAVGMLITDSEVEILGNTGSINQQSCPARLVPYMSFLVQLQAIHDAADSMEGTSTWYDPWQFGGIAQLMGGLAERHGLEKGVLYAAFPRSDAPEQVSRMDTIDLLIKRVNEFLEERTG